MATPSQPIRFHEVHGSWWLPDAASERRSGILTVDERGVHLRVRGHLGRVELPGVGDLPTHAVVYGRLDSGQDVTLKRAFTVNSTQRLFGERNDAHSEVSAIELLVGAHLLDPCAERFAAFSLLAPGLLRWAGLTGIRAEPIEGPRPATRFVYERPVDWVASLPHGGCVRLRTAARQNLGLGETRLAISEWGVLIVEPAEPLDLAAFRREYAIPLERLLTFSHEQVVTASQLSARLRDGGDHWVDVVTGREGDQPIDWRPPDRYVLAAASEEVFAALVPQWLKLHQRFRIPLDVHFAHAYMDSVPVERRLTEAMQALEGFDRIASPVSDETRAEHAARLERLREIASTEPYWARRLPGPLEYGYEPPLARRLSRRLKSEQGTIPLEGRERDALAQKMATNRNLLAHLDSARDHPPPEELYETGAYTTTLLKLMILRELGIAPDERRRICEARQWPRPGRPIIFLT